MSSLRAVLCCAAASFIAAASAASKAGSKVGTGFDFSNADDMQAMPGLRWWYDWGTKPSKAAERYAEGKDIEYVPMQWSNWGIEDLNKTASLKKASALLGFNEPNHRDQANLSPSEAAGLWPYMQQAADTYGLRLGTPSAAPCGFECVISDPFEWWDRFFIHCLDCRFDFLAVHIYSCNPDPVRWFLEACKKYEMPIWVTEFACPIGPGPHAISQKMFMASAVDYMDAHSQVERYAWFAPRVGGGWVGESASLLQPDRPALTELGSLYLQTRSNHEDSSASVEESKGAQAQPATTENPWRLHCSPCLAEGLLEGCMDPHSLSEEGSSLCEHCMRSCGFWPRAGSTVRETKASSVS